ncbi:NCK-interacting protein with SH3 domain [Fopius arisanus]|uniref:NCK-interacting protein with SH3 domain n=1 Tax=Fopius arisanus TaxID=64838 RepID=A0A0C9QM51_9HYME|nr:PREDICTED: NCK-interacting protein with SH3 domain [Fopius arisanus]
MGDNYIRLENYEMLKALYDFKATFAKTLSFSESDHFILHQSNTKQRNWWQVVNNAGQLGYIPSNYVTTVKVDPDFMISFLDDCIEKLRSEFSKPGAPLPMDKQDLVQRLIEKRRQADLSRKPKKQAPQPPTFTSSSPVKDSPIPQEADDKLQTIQNVQKTKILPYEGDISPQLKPEPKPSNPDSQIRSLPRQTSSEVHQRVPETEELQKTSSHLNIRPRSPKKSKSTPEMDSHAAYKILDEVRKHTQLSYEMSKLAVSVVVSGLQQYLPSNISHYFDVVLNQLEKPLMISNVSIEETYDAERLKVIFRELTSCKEDSQQRSWMLYEDEAVIVDYIKELTSILTNADANVSRHALRLDQYNGISTLIQYYQMEARWTIRQLLLQSFGVMCSLDPVVVTIMLNSILPMELARDMRSNPRNVPKLNYSSLLLTMIFSMGERMPITHVEQLGPEFISFLLELIEEPPDTDMDDQIPDLFLNLVLSYNLQFSSSENIVLNSLKARDNAKTFTQKILLLLNREEDPVRIFDHEPAPPHSVLKLFIDLFGSEITASLFYTNDVKVLIDIVLRQLFDIPPGEKRRLYLELCRRVLRTSGYDDHRHRSEDLLKCFTRIFCEEGPESQGDQQLIREISVEFPNLFKM